MAGLGIGVPELVVLRTEGPVAGGKAAGMNRGSGSTTREERTNDFSKH